MSNQIDTQTTFSNAHVTPAVAKEAHDRLRRALALMREAEGRAVTIFAEILSRRIYRELGYADIHIYADQALGFSRTKTYEFIRLAESLGRLPRLKREIETGGVPWTKASTIASVATPATEGRWLEMARGSSRRELERQVKRSRAVRKNPGSTTGQGDLLSGRKAEGQTSLESLPETPPEAAPVQTVSLRMDPLRRARFEALVEKMVKRHRCGKSEVLLMALEAFLRSGERPCHGGQSHRLDNQSNGSAPDTNSHRWDSVPPYQIMVHRCETCRDSTVGPDRARLSATETAQVECDAGVLELGERNRGSIPPARRRAVLQRDGHRCRVRGCSSVHFLEVHHIRSRRDGGSNDEGNLVVLCSSCHGFVHERGGELPPLREI